MPPEGPQKVRIIHMTDMPSGAPERVGKLDRYITYQLDAMRTYILIVAKEEYREEDLPRLIKADLEEKERLIGKELEI
ncbi:hypothetical protein ES705_31836 [subsurface metagenome]